MQHPARRGAAPVCHLCHLCVSSVQTYKAHRPRYHAIGPNIVTSAQIPYPIGRPTVPSRRPRPTGPGSKAADRRGRARPREAERAGSPEVHLSRDGPAVKLYDRHRRAIKWPTGCPAQAVRHTAPILVQSSRRLSVKHRSDAGCRPAERSRQIATHVMVVRARDVGDPERVENDHLSTDRQIRTVVRLLAPRCSGAVAIASILGVAGSWIKAEFW